MQGIVTYVKNFEKNSREESGKTSSNLKSFEAAINFSQWAFFSKRAR